MSRIYTRDEEIQMWLYVAKCLRDGDPLTRDVKGLRFWNMYKSAGHSMRSAQSLNTHFRKHLFDKLHKFELSGKDMLYLYKQLEIPMNPKLEKVKLEKQFNCTISLRDRNHTIRDYSFASEDLKKAKSCVVKERRSQTNNEVVIPSSSEDDEGRANENSFNLTAQFHDALKRHADNSRTPIRQLVNRMIAKPETLRKSEIRSPPSLKSDMNESINSGKFTVPVWKRRKVNSTTRDDSRSDFEIDEENDFDLPAATSTPMLPQPLRKSARLGDRKDQALNVSSDEISERSVNEPRTSSTRVLRSQKWTDGTGNRAESIEISVPTPNVSPKRSLRRSRRSEKDNNLEVESFQKSPSKERRSLRNLTKSDKMGVDRTVKLSLSDQRLHQSEDIDESTTPSRRPTSARSSNFRLNDETRKDRSEKDKQRTIESRRNVKAEILSPQSPQTIRRRRGSTDVYVGTPEKCSLSPPGRRNTIKKEPETMTTSRKRSSLSSPDQKITTRTTMKESPRSPRISSPNKCRNLTRQSPTDHSTVLSSSTFGSKNSSRFASKTSEAGPSRFARPIAPATASPIKKKIRSVVDEWWLEEAREKVCAQLALHVGDIDIARIIEDDAYKVSQNKNTYTEHIRSAISVFPTISTELSPDGPVSTNVADRFKCAVILKDPINVLDWHASINERSRQEIASKIWNESRDSELWDKFAKYIFSDFQSAEQKAFSFSQNENKYRTSLRTKLHIIMDEYHYN